MRGGRLRRITRKTECGAIGSLLGLVVRAAPFALLSNSPAWPHARLADRKVEPNSGLRGEVRAPALGGADSIFARGGRSSR